MEQAILVVKDHDILRTYLFSHVRQYRVREEVEKMFKHIIEESGYTCELEHLESQYFEDLSCDFTVAISYPTIVLEDEE